jgi:hypothetical protein
LNERRSTVAGRFVWGILVGLSLTLFVLSVPARYGELVGIARRASAQLGPGDELLRRFLAQGAYSLAVLSLEVVFVLAFALVSVALVWRNWDDWRPLFFSATFVTYSVWVTPTLDALALPSGLQALADLMQAAGLLMAIHFFLLFPNGHFVPGWTRLNALGWAVYCLAWGLFPGMPLSLIDPFEASFGAFLILVLLGWTVGLVAQAVRYRRLDSRQRTQTKWVLLVIAGAGVRRLRECVPARRVPAGLGPGQAPLRPLRRPYVLAVSPADPRRADRRDAQAQPIRRERPNQPHPRLRLTDGCTGRPLLIRHRGVAESFRRPYRREVHPCCGSLHPGYRCAVQSLPTQHTGGSGSSLLPQEVRY